MGQDPVHAKIDSLIESLSQQLDAIERFAPINALWWETVRSRADSDAAKHSLLQVWETGSKLAALMDWLLLAGDGPLIFVRGELVRFYYDRYVPTLETLYRLRAESLWPEARLGPYRRPAVSTDARRRRDPEHFSFLPLDPEDAACASPGVTMGDFIRQVYTAAELAIDWGEVEGDPNAFPEGLELLESRWFRPEKWIENSLRIRPLIVSRDPSKIPQWVYGRLREAYDCIIQDLHLAAIALCRSALEAVVVDRARRFGVETMVPQSSDLRRLRVITEDLSEVLPDLAASFDAVVTYGNQALHAPMKAQRTQGIVTPTSAEHFSFRCLLHLRRIVEALYADVPPSTVGRG